MKKIKINGKIFIASAASLLIVSAFCVGSYAALQQSNNPNSVQTIGQEEAKSIVLSHAGVDPQAVWFEDIETDREQGSWVYEIEFYADGVEYEYKVDAQSGKVLKAKIDRNDDEKLPVTDDAPSVDVKYISVDEAKAIALAHAGLDAANVRFEEAEFDLDDGRAVYELEFRSGAYEFEYEIDALTGKVLEADKEFND